MDESMIILQGEYGDEIVFEILDLIEYKGQEYAVLLAEDADGEVTILKVEESANLDENTYIWIDDEEILDAVFDIFMEKQNA